MKFLIKILFIIALPGCTSLMYGEKHMALSSTDRQVISQASNLLSAPNILSDEKVLIYFVAFDGTNNDCDRVNLKKERCTTVGEYYNKIINKSDSVNASNYYPGPSGLNAIYCFTCIRTAEKAINDFDKAFGIPINDLVDISEVRVVVIGFSRGAAIARHFMNELSSKYNTSLTNSTKVRVRSVALLYDTVDTYISGDMNIGLSDSTDYMTHIISRDENRRFFPVIRDNVYDLKDSIEGIRYSESYVEIQLPGAHSDVGGSYLNGIGVYYRAIADKFFFHLGLLNEKHFNIPSYSMTAGRHDSRGIIDKFILGTKPQSNIERYFILVNGAAKTIHEKELLNKRLNDMTRANAGRGYSFSTNDVSPLVFFVNRTNSLLEVSTKDRDIVQLSSSEENGEYFIIYRFKNQQSISKLKIPDVLYREIISGESAQIELVLLEGNDYKYFVYFLNGKEALRIN